MSAINDYLNNIKKQYPNTAAVSEQIEELRDTLHTKTEELQAGGLPYTDAANAAIASLGDVSELFAEVAGQVRTVFVNRLNRDNALLCTSIILAEFLIAWLAAVLFFSAEVWPVFGYSLVALLIGVGIWPVITLGTYRRSPDKTGTVSMPYPKQLYIALAGWGAVSLIVVSVNAIMGFDTVWFFWPVIGVTNWPMNIYNYHRQLTGGRYDAA